MRIERKKMLLHVARNVEKGVYPGYSYSTNALTEDCEMRDVWSLHQGHKSIYKHDKDAGGITMILKRPDMSTYVHMANLEEVVDTIMNHEDNFADYVEIDKMKAEYLSSPEGRWGV